MIATSVSTKFIAVDAYSPAIKVMQNNTLHFVEKANASIARQERLFRRLTPHLGHATKQLLSYASAGAVLGGLAYSGKAVMDYETAIQSLSAVTGVGGTQLEVFKAEIKDLGDKSKKSATDVAGSFEVIGSMMSQYLTDPKALRQIAESGITLAKASRQELVPTLENLTSIMNQFNLKAEDSNDVINRLTAGEIVGSLRTDNVAKSLQQFGANAATANVSLSESVALVEALAKQRPVENLGIDARNLLIVMDSAKALDKKARKSLRKSGVDMGFLMDKTHGLSERLHELSKIQNNQIGMTRVFGERNVTAAKVIFNQLGTYDAYLEKIKTTDEAQHQAAINSNTLAVSIEQLKNTWINYIATGDTAEKGLNKLKDAVGFVSKNLDTIVNVGVSVISFFAIWKSTLIAARIATTAYSVVLGINNFVTGASIGLLEADAVAQRVSMFAKQANAIATAGLTANMIALNAALAANPIGLVVIGLTALAGALYLVSEREKKLREEYQKKIDLNIANEINKETDSVKKLVWQYWYLGEGIKDATAHAIKFKSANIDFRRNQVEKRIKETKIQLEAEKNKLYIGDLFTGAFGEGRANYGKRESLSQQLLAQQEAARSLASDKVGINLFAQEQVGKGNINASDVFDKKKSVKPASDNFWTQQFDKKQDNENFDFYKNKPNSDSLQIDYARLGAEIAKAVKNSQTVDVKLSGFPPGTTATPNSSNIQTPNSY